MGDSDYAEIRSSSENDARFGDADLGLLDNGERSLSTIYHKARDAIYLIP